VRKHLPDDGGSLGGGQRFEETDLALAEDEQASFPQVFVESRERQAGLLGMRIRDAPVDAARPGQELEVDVDQGVPNDSFSLESEYDCRFTLRAPPPPSR